MGGPTGLLEDEIICLKEDGCGSDTAHAVRETCVTLLSAIVRAAAAAPTAGATVDWRLGEPLEWIGRHDTDRQWPAVRGRLCAVAVPTARNCSRPGRALYSICT